MKPRICVIGSSNTDMVIKVPHLPLPGETVLGSEFTIVRGGKGANQAVAAARAGGSVTFISCVGNDDFGRNALKGLTKEGIDVTHVKVHREKPSGIALINVSGSGENSISVAPGANACLTPDDIAGIESLIKSSQIVLVQLEIPMETVMAAIDITRKNNIMVILNPAPAQNLGRELLSKVDIITPNEKEAALLVQAKHDEYSLSELSFRLIGMGVNTVIITLGSKGAYYSNNGQGKVIKAFKVNAVDTTAAGDVFNGYLAVSTALGNSMEESVMIANKAAAISVTRPGAQPSIPYIKEVLGH